MNSIRELLRPHLKNLVPYATARDEYTGKEGVFLDANENPHGSATGQRWNRYPDPYQQSLKKKVASLKDVSVENIFLGNGSDEPIELLIRAFCEPGREAIGIMSPTYGMYKVSADIHNVSIRDFPLTADFQFDRPRLERGLSADIKLFFVCSPNNPSGNLMNEKDIEWLLEHFRGIVVLDEAYIDFCPKATFVNRLSEYPRLVIMQTFSKAWGMASLRVGMAFANQEIIGILNSIKAPYNLNGLVQRELGSALENKSKVQEWVRLILAEKKRLATALGKMEMVRKVFPSDANFLLVQFADARSVFCYLIDNEVIVRDRSSVPGCDGSLRITVGTVEENDQLLHYLNQFNS